MKPDGADTRAKITAVALGVLEKDGADAVTMRAVAGAVGITPMAIYHHFPGRHALLQGVADAEFERLAAEFRRLRRRPDAAGRIVDFGLAYVDYALARPRVSEFLFSVQRPHARKYPEDFRARRSPTLTPLADVIAEAMDAGVLRRDDVWEVALAVWAHVHGYIALYLAERIQLPPEEFRKLCRRSLKRLLAGIGEAP